MRFSIGRRSDGLSNSEAVVLIDKTNIDRGYRVIYSARRLGKTSRIYSANSVDGSLRQRDCFPMTEVAASGRDFNMVCYGGRLDRSGRKRLPYNTTAMLTASTDSASRECDSFGAGKRPSLRR
jgi:hypothetical protein